MTDDELGRRHDRDRRPRGARAGTLRLRLATELPWLGGYPMAAADGALMMRDPIGGDVHVVDRAVLARATRAVKRVVRDERPALAAEVGDVTAWQAAIEAAVEAMKPAIHDGAAIGGLWHGPLYAASHQRRALHLATRVPALAAVVHALGWIRVTATAAAGDDLAWLEARADALVRVARRVADGTATVLALRRAAEADGDRLIDALIAVLADDAIHTATRVTAAYLQALAHQVNIDGHQPPAPPAGHPLGPRLLAMLPRWLAAPAATRRLGLRLLVALRLPALAATWQRSSEHAASIAARLARRRPRTWTELVELRDLRTHATRELPPELDARALFACLAAPPAGLVDVIERLPASMGPGEPAAILLDLHDGAELLGDADSLAAAVAACVADDPDHRWPPLLRLIRAGALRSRRRRDRSLAHARRLGTALGRVLDDADRESWEQLDQLLARHPDVDAALARWRILRSCGGVSWFDLEPTLTLATTIEELREVAAALAGFPTTARCRMDAVVEAAGLAALPLLRSLIVAGEHARLTEATAWLDALHALRLRAPPIAAAGEAPLPPVLARYPAVFHPALARLADTGPGAAALAAGILDEAYPDPAATRRELAAIEARLGAAAGDARLARRAANLRARLQAPIAVGAARTARLIGKLARAVERAVFDRWVAALASAANRTLRAALGLDPDAPPAWASAPAYRRALAGIPRLPPRHRALARRVLARRAGPPPWDLRDAGANRAWLERVTARGLDARPWLDGIGARRDDAGHGALTLSLEDDPLEVLRMGEHFSTCLSPGESNFFAAVVNAADVNKRVVYGRDDDGRVVGRCLLALTDDGGLVTFEPFCHRQLDFASMVRRFVAELAGRMGALVVPRGQIRTLLGRDWYDDGARDLTGAFALLADGSAFRARLAALDPAELIETLTAGFAPLPLGGMIATLVLALPELDARPDLVVPLLPLVEASDDVALDVRLRAARLALRAGAGDLLGPRFLERLGPDQPGWLLCHDLLAVLARRAPSRFLALLRAARGRVNDAERPSWNYGFGLGLEALHRPIQAARHYQAAQAPGDSEAAGLARLRLQALAEVEPATDAPRDRRARPR